MRVNAASLDIRDATTSTPGTLNDLTTDLIMANNNNNNKSWQKVMISHEPHVDVSTVNAQGILAEKHKGKSGSYTQETPHVLVEKQKTPRHTCYSAPNSYNPALWMTLLCSMM